MKLTKSQELFVALGKISTSILIEIGALKAYSPEANAAQEFKLKQLRSLREQILRKALAAYETEKLVQQASAYERGFCAGRRIKQHDQNATHLNTMEKENLNIEDIKVGETYNVRVKVECIDEDGWLKVRTSEKAISFILSPKELEALSPLPKHAPCREFRAGDKVELKTNLGRNPYDTFDGQEYIPDGTVFTVLRDEWAGGKVDIFEKDESDAFTVHFSNLELVTPVEELEPYYLTESSDFWGVDKDDLEVEAAVFWKKTHPNAKAAAEAERDRLNADYHSAKNGTAPNS